MFDCIFPYLDTDAEFFYVVMEYCAGGDLKERMKAQKEKGFFEEQQVSVLCRNTYSGQMHIHSF